MISMSGISLSTLAARIEAKPAPAAPAALEGQSRTFTDRSNCRRGMTRHAEETKRPVEDFEVVAVADRDFRYQLKAQAAPAIEDGIPAVLKITPEEAALRAADRKAATARPIPAAPAAQPKENDAMANRKAAANARKPVDGERIRYDWTGAEEAAKAGKMPKLPDFSAETHKRFRPLLAETAKAAKAGDVKALKAIVVNPISTSPRAVDRYRNLCIVALNAQKKVG